MKSYLRDIENSLLKFLLEPSCHFPALFTMASAQNSIILANIGHGAGAGVGEVITEPFMETVSELNSEAKLLLRASFTLEEISGHLTVWALDRSSGGYRSA